MISSSLVILGTLEAAKINQLCPMNSLLRKRIHLPVITATRARRVKRAKTKTVKKAKKARVHSEAKAAPRAENLQMIMSRMNTNLILSRLQLN